MLESSKSDMPSTPTLRAAVLLVLMPWLIACGQKGDLYLPTDAPLAPAASGESLDDLDPIPASMATDRAFPASPPALSDP